MMLNFIKIIADCQGITRLKTKWHKINCWDNLIFFLFPFSSFLKIFIKFLGWNSYSFQKVALGLLFLKSFENLVFKKKSSFFLFNDLQACCWISSWIFRHYKFYHWQSVYILIWNRAYYFCYYTLELQILIVLPWKEIMKDTLNFNCNP